MQSATNFQIRPAASDNQSWNAVQVICIDIDDTLLDFEACAWESMQAGFAQWNLECPASSFPVFKKINQNLWKKLETGQLTQQEFCQIRWNLVFESLHIQKDGPAFEKVFRQYLYHSHVPVSGAKQALSILHQYFPLYIVSNGEQEQQMNRLARAGLLEYFRNVFTGESMQVKKPDLRFFDRCLDQIRQDLPGLQPENILIIGDSWTADIQGGQQAGWQTLQFEPEGGWTSVLDTLAGAGLLHPAALAGKHGFYDEEAIQLDKT